MKKTCFVIMGYETKKIPNTKIKINLDDTYNFLIKPVLISKGLRSIYLDDMNTHSFRGDEVITTQTINEMYIKNLYLADIVIADITTLNQNAIYELGIRHAMKPKSTIIMCDSTTIANNRFFDLTFNPQIIYNSEMQTDKKEIDRIFKTLSSVIDICIHSDKNYVDSPVFNARVYETTEKISFQAEKKDSLRTKIQKGKKLLEEENYERAILTFDNILKDEQYTDDEIVCMYILASYKKDISEDNLKNALCEMNNYIDINNTTSEDALGITAAINLRLFKLTNEAKYLYNSISLYRQGSAYESGNIYCSRNYCSSLLKIYLVENNTEIVKEYYYTAVHYAKFFLTQAQLLQRKSDLYNNVWFYSNQSDLFLISSNIKNMPYDIINQTPRQKTTIDAGRQDLEHDLRSIKEILGISD